MNAQQIQERFAGTPDIDYFSCLTASLEAARRRNKLAVQARLAGDKRRADMHQDYARWYFARVRQWHAMIDWSDEND
jgi:hypothetical protein